MPFAGIVNTILSSAFSVVSLVQFDLAATERTIQTYLSTPIEFGKFAMLGRVGTVRLQPSGARQITGDLVDLGGPYGPSVFWVQGEPGKTFVVVTSNIAVLAAPQGGKPIRVRKISSIPQRFGRFDSRGNAKITIGGEFIVTPANRDRGTYRGLASVSLAYVK